MARIRRQTKAARTRRRVLQLRSEKLSIAKIAKKLGLSQRWIYRILADARREWGGSNEAP